MIRAFEKPFSEISSLVDGKKHILIAGCETCVAICHAGGKKQADILGQKIRIHLKDGQPNTSVSVTSVMRQCELECDQPLSEEVSSADLVISTACGVGVQVLAEMYPAVRVAPALNTLFMGAPVKPWLYFERCVGCGDCLLDRTGGLCPVARCAKNLFNGPCGGSMNGKCEISPKVPCVWQEIIDKLRASGGQKALEEFFAIRDWSNSMSGSPRFIERNELKM